MRLLSCLAVRSFVFRMMATNPENREFAWEYFKDHFEAIHARFQPSPALFSVRPALRLVTCD